jgi:two-component sensor histidine kinase
MSLAMAMVASSTGPLLLLDGVFAVVAASASFCRAFKIEPVGVAGRSVFELGEGEWNSPRLRSLLSATANDSADIETYEMDLARKGAAPRCLILNAHKLVYDDAEQVRLLLTVTDVTDARAGEKIKDELIRERAVLLQEVQHRVANSLQIIASVLLQSARKVQSEETKIHLHDAHNRVMSIASVQKQLAASPLGYVELRAYFTQLCQSLGASMILENQVVIDVDVDGSVVTADVSVSLGLVVTELVINALKHAFPDQRKGRISMSYKSFGREWVLSVKDDGVGMSGTPSKATPGLGTSIIQALSSQLKADIEISDKHPGTAVSLTHKPQSDADEVRREPVVQVPV